MSDERLQEMCDQAARQISGREPDSVTRVYSTSGRYMATSYSYDTDHDGEEGCRDQVYLLPWLLIVGLLRGLWS